MKTFFGKWLRKIPVLGPLLSLHDSLIPIDCIRLNAKAIRAALDAMDKPEDESSRLDDAIRFALVTGPSDELEIWGKKESDRLTLPMKDVPLLAEALRQFKKTDLSKEVPEKLCPCLSSQICDCGGT